MLYTLITAAAVAFMAPTTVLQSSVQVRAARVEMNTQYTVAAGLTFPATEPPPNLRQRGVIYHQPVHSACYATTSR